MNTLLRSAVLLALLCASCSTIRRYIPENPFDREHEGPIKRVAVLPFAYRGADTTVACDLCPDRLVMDVTSEDDALLATAFLYEGLARYPRIQVLPYERVRDARAGTMRETLTKLAETEHLDAAIVGALLELRPRLGDPGNPQQRGGAAVYVALLELPSGRPVWKRVYDRTPAAPNQVMHGYHVLVGEEAHSPEADETARDGIDRMVSSLVHALR